jgi:hypothetical protein
MSISADRRVRAFTQSVSFDQFVESSQNFTTEFRENYLATSLDDQDRAILDGIDEPIDVLAIVEDWCPDVVANLPIFARVADETTAIRLHFLVRNDDTRDVADAYPYEGRSHIPTYVFSSRAGTELGVIVERTGPIRARVETFINAFFASHPELDRATFPASLTEEQKTELVANSLQLRSDLRDLERNNFVEAIGAYAASAKSAATAKTESLTASVG